MRLIAGHKPIEPAAGIPIMDVDPFDETLLAKPKAFYDEIRSLGPLVYIPKYSILATGQFDINHSIFLDHETYVSSRGVGLQDFNLKEPWRPRALLLENDPPNHTHYRRIMTKALSPKVVKRIQGVFIDYAKVLVEEALQKGSLEAVEEFSEVFPSTVFPRVMGLTGLDQRTLVDFGGCVFNAFGPDNRMRIESMKLQEVIAPRILEKCIRQELAPDGIGAAIYENVDTDDLTEVEAGLLVRALLSAGVDTTVTGLGNLLYCFAENPDQWDRLREDPKLVRPAIEEMLRYTSPVHSFSRTANADAKIAGFPVEEGSKILCVLGAANLDPTKWGGDADKFRIDRKPAGHMGFGAGVHGCVGQNIARAEIEAVFGVMIEKVARIEFDGEPIWRPNNAIHALDRLPLKLIPA